MDCAGDFYEISVTVQLVREDRLYSSALDT